MTARMLTRLLWDRLVISCNGLVDPSKMIKQHSQKIRRTAATASLGGAVYAIAKLTELRFLVPIGIILLLVSGILYLTIIASLATLLFSMAPRIVSYAWRIVGDVFRGRAWDLAGKLAGIASPRDAAWREEWPPLLATVSTWRRPRLLIGWMIAAIKSRVGWWLDLVLMSDFWSGLATLAISISATAAAWSTSGGFRGLITLVLTYFSTVSAIEALRVRRDVVVNRCRPGRNPDEKP